MNTREIQMPFVLFSEGRCGSSNLLMALQLHPQLCTTDEPFHKNYAEWNPGEPKYVELIKDTPTLEEQLTALFFKYEGMKVLDHQLPKELYEYLLLKPELNVIALRRRNVLQQVVSGFIGLQTGIWKTWDAKGERAAAYRNLKPIDLVELRQAIKYRLDLRQRYSDVLSRKPDEMHLELEYEKLYTLDVQKNRQSVCGVFEFLGLTAPATSELDDLLNPNVSKINGRETYELLPNARDIDEALGCEEYGWLFCA